MSHSFCLLWNMLTLSGVAPQKTDLSKLETIHQDDSRCITGVTEWSNIAYSYNTHSDIA